MIFLFDLGLGAWGLLLADALVYGCSSVSNGIAEGWATWFCFSGDFCIAWAFLRSLLGKTFALFFGLSKSEASRAAVPDSNFSQEVGYGERDFERLSWWDF